eukprot:9470003-Pyramimonas_sp.AAC.1
MAQTCKVWRVLSVVLCPPKKSAAKKAAANAKSGAVPAGLEVPDACKDNNVDHLGLVSQWLDAVRADPLVSFKWEEVLSMADGAHMAGYTKSDFDTAMRNGTSYTCAGCFAWQDCLKSPSPGVSISTKK